MLDGLTPYKIAKELKRPINTIQNEIRRGITFQIKQGKKVEMYLADTGEAIYKKNRSRSCRSMKRLECSESINHTVKMMQQNTWSLDACVKEALKSGRFKRSEIVCTKSLYTYIFYPFFYIL